MSRPVRTILLSTLYPSSVRPGHGIFVETRLRELLKGGGVDTRVVAPVPWFFSTHPRYGDYALMARTPARETHRGVDVLHPRYFLPPRVGMHIAPFLLAAAALRAIRRLQREGFDADVIDAHYYYPDGVAAALVAKALGKPFVVTARGTDVNIIADFGLPRRLMRWTADRAAASITVSAALRERLVAIGADPAKILVLRNGVDLERFRPGEPAVARAELGWIEAPTLISVGNLVENKGHHIAIEALARLPGYRLAVVGDGPERQALAELAHHLGVGERVTFTGRVPQERLPVHYGAADILLLPSSREGWPNVLLEAMACGTPVVATAVGGVPEVVASPVAGRLAAARDAASFAAAVREMATAGCDRRAVRRYAEDFGWEPTSAAQLALFTRLAGLAGGAVPAPAGTPGDGGLRRSFP